MAYIGVQPRLGNFQACDAISASATTTFNLLVGGTAIFPQSAQHCLVSLNGVLQAPISSYTISGSTIIFAAALTTDDSVDFITILGDTLDLGVPSDATVTTAKLGSNAVTSAKMFSGFANGITMADQWRLTADSNTGTNGFVTSNWERNDTTGYGVIGTGLTESSGVFSFASTGIYLINFYGMFEMGASDAFAEFTLYITTDNSSYNEASYSHAGNRDSGGTAGGTASNSFIFDITNISTHKFKFRTGSMGGSTYVKGNTSYNQTGFNVTRIGDT